QAALEAGQVIFAAAKLSSAASLRIWVASPTTARSARTLPALILIGAPRTGPAPPPDRYVVCDEHADSKVIAMAAIPASERPAVPLRGGQAAGALRSGRLVASLEWHGEIPV